MADTLLYIRHTVCTCRIRFIVPYSTGDTWLVHFCTSDIHPIHVVYAELGYIQKVIQGLYTFIHQTFACTCYIRSIGPYSTGDTFPVHFYTSDIHPVHVVYVVLGHIQPVIHGRYTFIHRIYTVYISYMQYWAIYNR